MLHAALLVSLALSASAFDDAKAKAIPIERLASTVASLVGVCPDGLDVEQLAECKENLTASGKKLGGKSVYVALGGGLENFITFERKDGDQAKFVWAPLVDLGNELALTVGRPQKLSDSGNVVVARRPFVGASDPELFDSDLMRAVKTGNVGVEIVGTFGKAWELRRKDGKPVRGVAFDLKALRFFHLRTGKTLLETTKIPDFKG